MSPSAETGRMPHGHPGGAGSPARGRRDRRGGGMKDDGATSGWVDGAPAVPAVIRPPSGAGLSPDRDRRRGTSVRARGRRVEGAPRPDPTPVVRAEAGR